MGVRSIEALDVMSYAIFDHQPLMARFRVSDNQALGGVAYNQTAYAQEIRIPHQDTAIVNVPVPANDGARPGAIGPDVRPAVRGAAGRDAEFLIVNASASDEQALAGPENSPVDVREVLPGGNGRSAGVGVASAYAVDVVGHAVLFT